MKNYKEILKMAVGNEVEAFEFYRDAAAKMKDPAMKKTFQELADEESGHKVLLEGYSKKSKAELTGRTQQNKTVVFPAGTHKKGDYVKVKIESCTSATLLGKEIIQ